MLKKQDWWQSWPRFLLWTHVVGVLSFYSIIWRRTAPRKEDFVHKLSARESGVQTSAQHVPLVSLLVPARNEEINIRRCVESLLEQDYAHCEILVINDNSTDKTAEILAEIARSHPQRERLRILHLRDGLPEGWAGKPHAIHCGTQVARGEWLLFTDADTWHAPTALRTALTQAIQEQCDLFTMASTQELPGFWDKVLMPMAFLGIGMLYPPRLVNDPQSPVAVANGQYILMRRKVYDLLGGYARPDLRGTLLDDRDLAWVVKQNGFRLHFVEGGGLVHVRMYRGLRDAWRGWRKNAYLGNRGGLVFTLAQVIGLPMIAIVPFLLPLLAWLTRRTHVPNIRTGEANIATIVEIIAMFSYRVWLNRSLGVPWYYVPTHPLAGGVFTAILAQSAWRVVNRKGVDWRGRNYYTK